MIVFLKLRCMSTLSVRLCGRTGMKHQGMFSPSGCVLKAIWCAWMKSCGVSWGGRIRRNMFVGCPSVLGCSRILLKVLVNISRGLRVFWYRVIISRLLRIFLLPQAGRLQNFWCDKMSKLLGAMPRHVLRLFPSLFPELLRSGPFLLIYGFHLGAYLLGPIYLLGPLSVIGGSATLFGLCRLSSICIRSNRISFWFRWYP